MMTRLILAFLLAAQAWAAFTPAQTCGVVTVAGSGASVPSNYKFTNKFTCPAMVVTRGHIRVSSAPTDAAAKTRMVIYASSSGPTTLLGMSDEVTGLTNVGAWLDFVFSTPVTLAAGDYYIGYIYQASGNLRINITTGAGVSAYNSDAYADGPAAAFGTPTTGTERGHMYVESDGSAFDATACGGLAASFVNRWGAANTDQKISGKHPCPALTVTDGYDWQYGDAPAGTKLRMAIYADSSGSPGALLAVSNEVTTGPIGEEARWLRYTFTPFALPAGNYWIAIIASNTYYEVTADSANPGCWNADTYSDGPSDPYGSCTSNTGMSGIYLQSQVARASSHAYIM